MKKRLKNDLFRDIYTILKTNMKTLVSIIAFGCLALFLSCNLNKREITIEPDWTPTQVVDLFWRGSRSGDEELVEKLVTTRPESYSKLCAPPIENDSPSEVQILVPDVEKSKKEALGSRDYSISKFGRFLYPESESFGVYLWANLMFVNKYDAARASIEKETIYQDQARIVTRYRNPNLQEDFKLVFFLTKQSEGWKIFEIKDSSHLDLIINKNFGIAALDCKQ